MPSDITSPVGRRTIGWEWLLCGVLLSATLLNYAARQALSTASVRVQDDLKIDKKQYGEASGIFSVAFGVGAVLFGLIADTVGVRRLYPTVVLIWSAMAVVTGRSDSFQALWWSQLFLGLFESGHWPSALRTTQRVFAPARRTLGNALLQAGAAVGAIVVCLLMLTIVTDQPGSWRSMFTIIGVAGVPWAVLWLATIRDSDLRQPVLQTSDVPGGHAVLQEQPLWRTVCGRRFLLLVVMVVCMNVCWHYIRVWLPLTLEEGLHYSSDQVQQVMIGYWLSTLAGSLISGNLVNWLARHGAVQKARMGAFLVFALVTGLMVVAARLPAGWALIGLLMLVGCGSLAQFPIYYSLTQELSAAHQGKIGGLLGLLAWLPLYWFHPFAGKLMDKNPDARVILFTAVGLLPLAAWAVVAAGWGKNRPIEVPTA